MWVSTAKEKAAAQGYLKKQVKLLVVTQLPAIAHHCGNAAR